MHRTPFTMKTILCAAAVAGCSSEPADYVEATGYLEVDGTRTELGNAVVERSIGGYTLALTDQVLPPGCVGATSAFATFEAGQKFAGIDIRIRRDEGLATGGMVVHPSFEPIDGMRQFAAEHPVTVTDGIASGTFTDEAEISGHQVKTSVDFSFSTEASYVTPPDIAGGDSAPAKAFRELVDAWMAGDLDRLKALSSGEASERLSSPEALADPEGTAEQLLVFADMMFPRRISIESTEVNGDSATLTATGEEEECGLETRKSNGRIEMVREEGQWKVGAMNWES